MSLEWVRSGQVEHLVERTRRSSPKVVATVVLADNYYEIYPDRPESQRVYGVGASLEGARREVLEELQESLSSPRRRTLISLTPVPPEYRSREDILEEEIFRRFQ